MIAINGKIFTQKMTGLGRYSFEIVSRLVEKEIPLCILTPNRPLDDKFSELQPYVKRDSFSVHPFVWETLRLPFLLNSKLFEALWSPANIGPLYSSIPHYVTLHDLSFNNPEWMNFYSRILYSRTIPLIIRNSEKIICDAKFISDEIASTYSFVKPDRINWSYAGCDHLQKPVVTNDVNGEKAPYFIVLGSVEKRKNVDRIIEAWNIAKTSLPKSSQLLVIGSKKSKEKFDLESLDSSINLLGYLTDEEIVSLLAAARGLLFPSLYEGFGFPIVEAMSLGCPVITSNIGTMKEVAGENAILVDPYSAESIATAIVDLAKSNTLYHSLKEKSIIHASLFTWDKTTEFYIESIFSSDLN